MQRHASKLRGKDDSKVVNPRSHRPVDKLQRTVGNSAVASLMDTELQRKTQSEPAPNALDHPFHKVHQDADNRAVASIIETHVQRQPYKPRKKGKGRPRKRKKVKKKAPTTKKTPYERFEEEILRPWDKAIELAKNKKEWKKAADATWRVPFVDYDVMYAESKPAFSRLMRVLEDRKFSVAYAMHPPLQEELHIPTRYVLKTEPVAEMEIIKELLDKAREDLREDLFESRH